MFLYCITPNNNVMCNFIKIGICKDIITLKSRYITYYGDSCIYYYIKVINKSDENNVHEKLKKLGLHLENELFILNKEYNYDFYKKILKEFEKSDSNSDIYTLKRNFVLDFIIYIYKKKLKFENEYIINYKKDRYEEIWKTYLIFSINTNKYITDKRILKKYIQSMIYCDNPIIYKNYNIDFNSNEIIIKRLNFNKNKYKRCKNKMKILLLYQYVKIKKEIIENNRYNMEYGILCNVIKKEIINKKLKNIRFSILKDDINYINKYISFNENKIYNKKELINIITRIKKIVYILQYHMEIHFVVIYINQLLKCFKENTYQNDVLISLKKIINKD